MSNVINELEKLRKLKIKLYLFVFLIFISLLFIDFYIKNKWFYYLIIFNNCILVIINTIFIEIKVGYRYKKLYHEFFNKLIKLLDSSFEYENAPTDIHYEIFDNKLCDFNASSKIDNILRLRKNSNIYELLDIKLYLNPNRSHKILLFKGYLLTLRNKEVTNNEILILNAKKPLFGDFRLIKKAFLGKYKIYSINDHINESLLEKFKFVLDKNLKKGNKFNIYIGEDIIIFKRCLFSTFNKPFIFQKINHKFIDKKIYQLKNILIFINDFIDCL
ncbi:MAG: hypothetical protein K0Q49_695 [Haloplasmataceae bacterium]|jgi:hypothetical protein|nr:hypothetical protein [Haloplasmataceae bacterium]